MALTRQTEFNTGTLLTESGIEGEFDYIYNNALTLISPLTGNLACGNYNLTGLGHLLFTDNTYDIGASGATRPRTGYFGTSVVTPVVKVTTALITATDGSGTGAFTANMVASTGGPTTAAQNGWMKFTDSGGATVWIPVWK